MKELKAPEKIWVHEQSAMELNVPLSEYHVEYIRADAFIEKACEYLNCNLSGIVAIKVGDIAQGYIRTRSEFIDAFKKYMKGE